VGGDDGNRLMRDKRRKLSSVSRNGVSSLDVIDEKLKKLAVTETSGRRRTQSFLLDEESRKSLRSRLFSPDPPENEISTSIENRLLGSHLFPESERPASSASDSSASRIQPRHLRTSSSSSSFRPPISRQHPLRSSFGSETSFLSGDESSTSFSGVSHHRSASVTSQSSTPHRHSESLDQIARLIKEFDYPASGEKGHQVNLENHGWGYHGVSRNGVRIYSKSPEMLENEGISYAPLEEEVRSGYKYMKRESSYFHGESESLPYIRGDGWIDGDWKVEDIVGEKDSFHFSLKLGRS
jgi:hypothetical protein